MTPLEIETELAGSVQAVPAHLVESCATGARSHETARPKGKRSNRRVDWIDRWEPEDPIFWAITGKKCARKNLVFSIVSEHVSFSVWLLWSVIAIHLNDAGFNFSTSQLFWLVAIPNLVGAFMRLPYTFAVTRFGGRNWTTASSLFLVIPMTLLVLVVSNPSTPYYMFMIAAALAGLGGGNFASSMANISFFYPDRSKGAALGINAAGGNLGVSAVQFLVPLVIAAGGGIDLARAGVFWAVLAGIAALCAWLFMDNLHVARSSLKEQLSVMRCSHTWTLSLLYIGTFGSFIGYSSALPLLIKTQFPATAAAQYAFLGPLVGSLSRPIGGWIADRFGGAAVTFWTFMCMSVGSMLVLSSLKSKSFLSFIVSFLFLFILSGIGNGSTYRMIPHIFGKRAASQSSSVDNEPPADRARRDAAAVIGIAAAVGAAGGFLIPLSYGTFGITGAFCGFLGFYGFCLLLTWWRYVRRSA